ncbi:MAG: hypothetical protein ACE5M4_10020 [Anaerolineales bacterium]
MTEKQSKGKSASGVSKIQIAHVKPPYEPPHIMDLGELAKGVGTCITGASAAGLCAGGSSASIDCYSGGTAISTCTTGTTPA